MNFPSRTSAMALLPTRRMSAASASLASRPIPAPLRRAERQQRR